MYNDELEKANEYANHVVESDVDNTILSHNMNSSMLNEFKVQVKAWMELDIEIKRLQMAVKDRKKTQSKLNENILDFMTRYDIEDLNTKYGTLRYKTTTVKTPLSQKTIRKRLDDTFGGDERVSKVIDDIFVNRGHVEKHSLRRLA
jgi:hypothetical protein